MNEAITAGAVLTNISRTALSHNGPRCAVNWSPICACQSFSATPSGGFSHNLNISFATRLASNWVSPDLLLVVRFLTIICGSRLYPPGGMLRPGAAAPKPAVSPRAARAGCPRYPIQAADASGSSRMFESAIAHMIGAQRDGPNWPTSSANAPTPSTPNILARLRLGSVDFAPAVRDTGGQGGP